MKLFTRGQAWAVQILTARDLRLEVNMIKDAEKYLKTERISPVLIGSFAKEANIAVELINKNNLQRRAKNFSEKYIYIFEMRNRNKNAEKQFFKTIGVREYKDGMFIIFDKNATFVKVINYKEKYDYIDDCSEKELKPYKLYGHCLSAFRNREAYWYEMSLREQLENLCWNFTKSGVLKNTAW